MAGDDAAPRPGLMWFGPGINGAFELGLEIRSIRGFVVWLEMFDPSSTIRSEM